MNKFIASQQTLAYTACQNIDNIDNLIIHAIIGELELIPYDKNEILAEFYFEKSNYTINFDIKVVKMRNTVYVVLDKHDENCDVFCLTNVCTKVYIPREYNNKIYINGDSANCLIQDVNADELELNLNSGSVIAQKICSNKLFLTSVTGNIDIQTARSNDITLKTKSGMIKAENVSLKNDQLQNGLINISTISGEVVVFLKDNFKRIKINSVSGGVNLSVPSTYNFISNFSSVCGKIKNSVFNESNCIDSNTVSIHTVSSNITFSN